MNLVALAEKYENKEFLIGDPSWFMHQVSGELNQELLAFIASSLSFGARQQFLPKIQFILDSSGGNVYSWVKNRDFDKDIPPVDTCFYRLYTCRHMNQFLHALAEIIDDYMTLKNYVIVNRAEDNCFRVVEVLTSYFAGKGISGIIPKNTQSSCKRICMFLRWMVRDHSPVDLGLWSDIIDKRTLIMPLDTHVLQQAVNLGLIKSKTGSMKTAVQLSKKMLEYFPDDPLKGDFALFGYGVNQTKKDNI